MATTRAPPRQARAPHVSIQTLEPSDVGMLRLPGQRGARALRLELEQYPGRSVWAPATLEFAIVGPWRNRPEIACVNELVAVRYAEPLLRAAFERCVGHGDDSCPEGNLRAHEFVRISVSVPCFVMRTNRALPKACEICRTVAARRVRFD